VKVLYEQEGKAREFESKYNKDVYALKRLGRDNWHLVAGDKCTSEVCRFYKVAREPTRSRLARLVGNISL
jgi:hypothetical protein